MSEFFSGITFPEQKVTPSDDASIRRSVLVDGILSGCEISYVGSTLTLGAGLMVACGRQFRHTSAQNFAVTGANSGYARLVLAIDTTRASTKDNFDQIDIAIEYATALDGFAPLRQDNINEAGTVYQMVICVVSLGAGGISGIVSKVQAATVRASDDLFATFSASNWHDIGSGFYQSGAIVNGLLASDLPIIDVSVAGLSPSAALKANEEFAKIVAATALDGSLWMDASGTPEVDLMVKIKVVR